MTSGDRSHAERARLLLAEHPELSSADIYAAAAAGDVAAVNAMLARDPALVNVRGGCLGWQPLLYACYSRLDSPDPTHSTVEVRGKRIFLTTRDASGEETVVQQIVRLAGDELVIRDEDKVTYSMRRVRE